MSATAALVRKEFRAVAALWLAILAGILAGLVPMPQRDLRELGPLFYVIGALALGANAFGHEYRNGTLAQALMQPVARGQILAAKMSVLAALLIALAAVAAAAVFSQFRWAAADREALIALFVLPLAYGFLVAPWLTLLTRRTLAGTLFSGALAALLLVAGNWIGWLLWDSDAAIDAFKMRVLWVGSSVLLIAAAVGLWRSVDGLQVTDGPSSEVALSGAFRVARGMRAARRHPVLVLVGKELRLQQLTFVASALYALVCAALWTRREAMPLGAEAIAIATTVHALVVVALAGASSCAEERALGTLDWQLLLPRSARAQFALKAATTLCLAGLLAIGLPWLLSVVLGIPRPALPRLDRSPGLLVLLSGSVYISSVSSSAVAAFLACIPAFTVAYWFLLNVIGRLAFATVHTLRPPVAGTMQYVLPLRADAAVADFIGAGIVLLVLGFAFENYRTADRSAWRIVLQVGVVVGSLTACCLAFAAAGRILFL